MPVSKAPRKPYRPKGGGVWDDINRTKNEAKNLQVQALSCAPMVRARMESGAPYDRAALTAAVSNFDTLIRKYNGELETIDASCLKRHGDVGSNDELVAAIGIGQQYRLWIERWSQEVIPAMNQVLTIIKD